MFQLIDDLLDIARIARGKIELSQSPVELSKVICGAIEICKHDIEAHRLEFGVDLGPAAPYWVEADVPRLQQVFCNLLRNSIKFTPHGGRVGIRCRQDGTQVVVDVVDSGMGIEPVVLPRLFTAFEQAERSVTRRFSGLGLGLAISKTLVEMHGGTISAHSDGPGKGATFRIRLPLRITTSNADGNRFEAAQPIEGDKPPLRRFTMTAYTGGAMQLTGWRYPVVVDLSGLRVTKKSRPILKDHNAGLIVGHTEEINVGDNTLEVSGVVSGAGAVAQEIIATSENGFPWQASIGATADKVVFVTEGRTASANGREFTGPVYIARKSTLGEARFRMADLLP